MMRHRRTQLSGNVVTPERRDRHRRENAWHDGQQQAPAPGRFQGAAKDGDRQHRTQRELQSDRLVHQRQGGDHDAVSRTACQRNGARAGECQRHSEHRQRRRTEQVRPGRVSRERNPKGQQGHQHRDHQPALGPAPAEQHHAHDQGEAAHIHRGRQPAQSERDHEVVAGHQTRQLACEATTDETERVVDGVIGHPIHVERNNVDREAQHGRRPDRDCNGDADVKDRPRTLIGFETQVHHQNGPSRCS
jgi:hypothetical protein